MKRRNIIQNALGVGALLKITQRGIAQDSVGHGELFEELVKQPIFREEQFGDPDVQVPELLSISPDLVQKAVGDYPAEGKKDGKFLAEAMVNITRKFADEGVSRWYKPETIEEILSLCDLPMKMGGSYVPYCAAGVAYAACRAYCDVEPITSYPSSTKERLPIIQKKLTTIAKHYFYPSAAVRIVRAKAVSNGTWVGRDASPKNGWLVIFGWKGNTTGNHIGIVDGDHADEKVITTLEYNTAVGDGDARNGGAVARKERPRNNSILGFVKLY